MPPKIYGFISCVVILVALLAYEHKRYGMTGAMCLTISALSMAFWISSCTS